MTGWREMRDRLIELAEGLDLYEEERDEIWGRIERAVTVMTVNGAMGYVDHAIRVGNDTMIDLIEWAIRPR